MDSVFAVSVFAVNCQNVSTANNEVCLYSLSFVDSTSYLNVHKRTLVVFEKFNLKFVLQVEKPLVWLIPSECWNHKMSLLRYWNSDQFQFKIMLGLSDTQIKCTRSDVIFVCTSSACYSRLCTLSHITPMFKKLSNLRNKKMSGQKNCRSRKIKISLAQEQKNWLNVEKYWKLPFCCNWCSEKSKWYSPILNLVCFLEQNTCSQTRL